VKVQSPLDTQVSIFRGSTVVTPVEAVSLADCLHRIKGGRYRGYVEQLRRLLTTKGEEVYDKAKRRSMAFTPAGTFTSRNSASLDTPSGCLNLDIDDLTDLDHARATIGADPHLLYMFVSPSASGLKLGFRVSDYTDAASYRHTWLAVERYLVDTYPDLAVNNDTSCKDLSRLCYFSWDPDCYSNPSAVPFLMPPAQTPTLKPIPQSTSHVLPADRRQRYAEHAIAAAIKILDRSVARTPTSNGTRDRQRLKASRLLGGYIAGGVLTEGEAKAGIAVAIERNTDKLHRAWRVIERGLRYGEASPITLYDLEADYQRWLEIYRQSHRTPQAEPPELPHSAPSGTVHHAVPPHILQHPDRRVREHWKRVYRRTAILKERLYRAGVIS
jgi:VirE N-terminal domain